jgi:hypothetical protein
MDCLETEVKMNETQKPMKPWTGMLPVDLLRQGRELSDKTGVPFGRMMREALPIALEMYEPRKYAERLTK